MERLWWEGGGYERASEAAREFQISSAGLLFRSSIRKKNVLIYRFADNFDSLSRGWPRDDPCECFHIEPDWSKAQNKG